MSLEDSQRDHAALLAAFVNLFLDPLHNDAGKHPEWCASFREGALRGRRVPLVLPRLWEATGESAYYVIARRPHEAGVVRDLLLAFAGPSLVKVGYDIPVKLDDGDVLEAAIAARYGPSSTFKLRAPVDKRKALHGALIRMLALVENSPQRAWSAPKPLGRLLTDFESALVGGAPQVAAELLDQIARQGGLSVTNLKHLQIKRLAVMGQASELLAVPGLREVLLQDPPRAVKEIVLSALHATCIEPALTGQGVEKACAALAQSPVPIALLADAEPVHFGDSAAVTLLLGLLAQGQEVELAGAIAALDAVQRSSAVPPGLDRYRALAPQAACIEAEPTADVSVSADEAPSDSDADDLAWQPASWEELLAAAAEGDKAALRICRDMESDGSSELPLAADSAADAALAALLSGLSDASYENVWRYALSPFLQEVSRSGLSLPLTLAQITASSIGQRRDPANLAVLDLLLELFLRTSPAAEDYDEFLEHLTMRVQEWVASETASQALDFVDRLAAFATPDQQVRAQAALQLLSPLNRHAQRLDEACLASARSLSSELELDLDWPAWHQPGGSEDSITILPAQVLIYGMDAGVLDRVHAWMAEHHPQVKVSLSADKVGSSRLREVARHADFSVLITQCATHAATNFISQHAQAVVYPKGAGSVSVVRAIVDELQRHSRSVQLAAAGGRRRTK
ncbi:protein DpdD [Streptomyces sp. NBC_01788]|uniref:protein DpdD n=1 Tax=Streptomyces sp. NBC_01788 TaxID=2975940 RepID=UPI002DD8BA05|nr:protein DpdD [Streptomyces sp. NBC_01788]WSB24511.1 protein DpdD [Streptomyces sp. NBC_01788]